MDTRIFNSTLTSRMKLKWESKKTDLSLINYIFGLNASGKTSIGKIIKSTPQGYVVKLFNNDYIANNVFSPKLSNGHLTVEAGSKNNAETFEIMFGEDLKSIHEANVNLNMFGTLLNDELLSIVKQMDPKFNKITDSLQGMKFDLGTNIKTLRESEYHEISNSEIERIEGEIKIFKNIDLLNNLIIITNNIVQYCESMNLELGRYNTLRELDEKHPIIIEIHQKASQLQDDSIEFCGEYFKISDVKLHLEKMTKERKKSIDKIKQLSSNLKATLKQINDHPQKEALLNDPSYPGLRDSLNKIVSSLGIVGSSILKNYEISDVFEFSPLTQKDKNSIFESITSWYSDNKYSMILNPDLLNKNKEDYDFGQKIIDENNREFRNKINKLESETIERVNRHLRALGSGYLEIGFSTPPGNKTKVTKMYLKDNELNMGSLSEGEKSNIALSYFLVDLEKTISSLKRDDKIIAIFDDPFDSNDHQKMDSFSDIEFELCGKKESYRKSISGFISENKIKYKEIILTHNIAVLSSLTRNLTAKDSNIGNMFSKLDEKKIKGISLFELRNSDSVSRINDVNLSLLFPLEGRHIEVITKVVENSIKLRQTQEIQKTIVTLLLLLIKLNDGLNSELRNKYMNTISGKWIGHITRANSDKMSDIDSDFVKFIKSNFESMTLEADVDFLRTELSKQNVTDIDIFIEYILLFIKRANLTLDSGDKAALKRLRHKTNYHYSGVGYAMQE